MSDAPAPDVAVLVVEGDDDVRTRLVDDLRGILEPMARVEPSGGAAESLRLARTLLDAGTVVPIVFVERTLPDGSGADVLRAMHDDPDLRSTRKVLLTSRPSLHEVHAALGQGAVHGMLSRPWTRNGLREQVRAHLATFYADTDPSGLDAFDHLLGDADRAAAARRVALQHAAHPPTAAGAPHFLLDPTIDDDEVERMLVEALDRALGHPPRLRIAPGSVLIEEGEDVGGIYVILDGEVGLRRHTPDGIQILHSRSTGAIVGLLSLTGHSRAFLECRAVTDVVAIPLTIEQLGRALAVEPELSELLTRVLLSSLARRLRRADDLQVEVDRLNHSLARERDDLTQALAALERAQERLVSHARLATLGELAAGIAHELNNPNAALQRAARHLAEDVTRLVGSQSAAAHALQIARDEPPLPTEQVRARRRRLTEDVLAAGLCDRRAADRLWGAGVRDLAGARELLAGADAQGAAPGGGPIERLEQAEAATQVGTALRSIERATERLGALVGSLRSYLHGGAGDEPFEAGVDVVAGVEDALRLLGHRLDGASIERRYAPVPAITARPGALQQVWTNLLANALDATDERGRIEVLVEPAEGGGVRVDVVDDGPGMPPDVAARVFEPRFTTKQGQVTFGMGLGLTICRRIVDEHGGTITLESEPGRTVVTVHLPATPPATGRPEDIS